VRGGLEHEDDISEYFSLACPADSRLWRFMNSGDEFSAPMLLTSTDRSFDLLEVTVSAPFEETFDQAGIVIFCDMSPEEPWISPTSPQGRRRRRMHSEREHTGKWAKASLQQTSDGTLGLATVITHPNGWPDQSFAAITFDTSAHVGFQLHKTSLRIKFERVNDALWVWYRMPESFSTGQLYPEQVSNQYTKAREVGGFFAGSTAKSRVMVGCYASRPLENEKEFEAEFEALDIFPGS